MTEFNFYQIGATGVQDTELVVPASGTNFTVIDRRSAEKISEFGSNNIGLRMSTDYTRTDLGFESKDDLSNYEVLTADPSIGDDIPGRSTNVDHNPYLIGSSVKKTRDDQFTRMGMTTSSGAAIDYPDFDVMDTNLVDVTVSGVIDELAGKNWPTEGYRSYGGKYDFEPYQGGGIH